ncbi:MAG: hypothetical protein WD852_10470 [Methyloceanibacter sp.]
MSKRKAKAKSKPSLQEIISADVPVWGAEDIGRVIGRDTAATYHLIYSGALDGAVKKVKGRHCGRPSKLIEAVT